MARADYTLREFVAKKDDEERSVFQYHFQVGLVYHKQYCFKFYSVSFL